MLYCNEWNTKGSRSKKKQPHWQNIWYISMQLWFTKKKKKKNRAKEWYQSLLPIAQFWSFWTLETNKYKMPSNVKDISSLWVLVLWSNKFYGSVGCGMPNATRPIIQIVGLASNNFSGKLSIKALANSKSWLIIRPNQSTSNLMLNKAMTYIIKM